MLKVYLLMVDEDNHDRVVDVTTDKKRAEEWSKLPGDTFYAPYVQEWEVNANH